MQRITITILEGLDRGRVYDNLYPPIKIGREDDNTIQLNDDRVSRYHAKIQDSEGHLILTDLQSTNGTRVNGFPVNIRVLQPGDHIWIGRCLLYVSPALSSSSSFKMTIAKEFKIEDVEHTRDAHPAAAPISQISGFENGDHLFPLGMPGLPENLNSAQLAMLSDYIAYIHHIILQQANLAFETEMQLPGIQDKSHGMFIPDQIWQQLLQMEKQLAIAMHSLSDP